MTTWPEISAPPMYDNPAPGWEDLALPDFRVINGVARRLEYVVGLHGSMKRDCDLIAVPWSVSSGSAEELVEAICLALGGRVVGQPAEKPHGRRAWIIDLDGWVKHIDLSVMPRTEGVEV